MLLDKHTNVEENAGGQKIIMDKHFIILTQVKNKLLHFFNCDINQ